MNCLFTTPQGFLWNLGGNLHNPIAFAFCMLARSRSCGWCHLLLWAGTVIRSSWDTAAEASELSRLGKHCFRLPCVNISKAAWSSLLRGKIFKWAYTFILLSLWWWIPEMFSRNFFLSFQSKAFGFFIMLVIYLTAPFLVPNLNGLLFWSDCILQIFLLYFCPWLSP
jgi:hypothetical protein